MVRFKARLEVNHFESAPSERESQIQFLVHVDFSQLNHFKHRGDLLLRNSALNSYHDSRFVMLVLIL